MRKIEYFNRCACFVMHIKYPSGLFLNISGGQQFSFQLHITIVSLDRVLTVSTDFFLSSTVRPV